MEYLIKYLFSGYVYKYPKQSAISLTIFNYSDIYITIIPFFETKSIIRCKIIRI